MFLVVVGSLSRRLSEDMARAGNYDVFLNSLRHENSHEEDWKSHVGQSAKLLEGEKGAYNGELNRINLNSTLYPAFYIEKTKKIIQDYGY
jgi:hypothetical protein